jgi:hypothetical protein
VISSRSPFPTLPSPSMRKSNGISLCCVEWEKNSECESSMSIRSLIPVIRCRKVVGGEDKGCCTVLSLDMVRLSRRGKRIGRGRRRPFVLAINRSILFWIVSCCKACENGRIRLSPRRGSGLFTGDTRRRIGERRERKRVPAGNVQAQSGLGV